MHNPVSALSTIVPSKPTGPRRANRLFQIITIIELAILIFSVLKIQKAVEEIQRDIEPGAQRINENVM